MCLIAWKLPMARPNWIAGLGVVDGELECAARAARLLAGERDAAPGRAPGATASQTDPAAASARPGGVVEDDLGQAQRVVEGRQRRDRHTRGLGVDVEHLPGRRARRRRRAARPRSGRAGRRTRGHSAARRPRRRRSPHPRSRFQPRRSARLWRSSFLPRSRAAGASWPLCRPARGAVRRRARWRPRAALQSSAAPASSITASSSSGPAPAPPCASSMTRPATPISESCVQSAAS